MLVRATAAVAAAAAAAWAFGQSKCVVFLLLPFGAGSILGVYVTVLVTTSRICRTLFADDFCALQSCAYLDFNAASQSNGDRTDLALNGDRAVALNGESRVDTAGEGGM